MPIKSAQIRLGLEAWACVAAGQLDEARKIADTRLTEPTWAPLRAEPRFQELLRKLDLPV